MNLQKPVRRAAKVLPRLRVPMHLPPPSRRTLPPAVVWRSLFRRDFPHKVDFVVAGTMRGGTTALFEYVRQHPQICVSARKEVQFFNRDQFFRGPPDYAKYHAWFDPKPSQTVIGEASPSYMFAPRAPQRLHDYNPDLKLIMILRDPVERAHSHWNMERHQGWYKEPFAAYVERYRRFSEGAIRKMPKRGFVSRGQYAAQIERVWQLFPRAQTLFLRNEDLRDNRDATLDRFFEFVGVDPFKTVPIRRSERSDYAEPITDRDRAFLVDVYRPDIEFLQAELGWDCSAWLA